MNFFSLDFYTYNLNISRMWLINTLLLLKMESLLADSRIVSDSESIKISFSSFQKWNCSPGYKIVMECLYKCNSCYVMQKFSGFFEKKLHSVLLVLVFLISLLPHHLPDTVHCHVICNFMVMYIHYR